MLNSVFCFAFASTTAQGSVKKAESDPRGRYEKPVHHARKAVAPRAKPWPFWRRAVGELLGSLSTTTPNQKGKPLARKAIKPRGFNPDLIEAGLSELLCVIVFGQGSGDTARPGFQKIQ